MNRMCHSTTNAINSCMYEIFTMPIISLNVTLFRHLKPMDLVTLMQEISQNFFHIKPIVKGKPVSRLFLQPIYFPVKGKSDSRKKRFKCFRIK